MKDINTKYLALIAAAGLTVLSGCQRDTIVGDYDGILRIRPSVDKLSGVGFRTRGVLINENGSEYAFKPDMSFFVRAYDAIDGDELIAGAIDGYQEVKMVGTQWNTVYTKDSKEYCQEYLWKPGEKKTFYAYANLPASGANVTNTDASVQTLTYTVPYSTSDQTDILLGYYSGDGKTGEPGSEKMTGTASIHFYHPLTSVLFKQSATFQEGVSIKEISIVGVYPSGQTEQSSATSAFTWTKIGGSPLTADDATQTVSLSTVTVDPDTKQIGTALLLIPQDFDADSESYIKVVLKDAADDSKTLDLYYLLNTNIGEESPKYASWKAGYTNVYTISFNGSGLSIDGPDEYNGSPLGGYPSFGLSCDPYVNGGEY